MPHLLYRGRRAVQIENNYLRVTVLEEGGHIAEILDKRTHINPLWTPPWNSIEPSQYDRSKHPAYGADSESKLLAGIMGHNLCLDLFGAPSAEEAAAGLTVHGEGSVVRYGLEASSNAIRGSAELPLAGLHFERQVQLDEARVLSRERVSNLSAYDRPIAWTQHVTVGPPFLVPGEMQIRMTATKSRTYESELGNLYRTGTDFEWPLAPAQNGGSRDLRTYPAGDSSSGYTAQLMDPSREEAYFLVWSPAAKLLFGYRWKRSDFPWLGIWIENRERQGPPWNGKTTTCGLEFGVSPMPEPRRAMIERASLFGVPAYRWLPAKSFVEASYSAFVRLADRIPETL